MDIIKRNLFPILTIGVFAALFILAVVNLMYEAKGFVTQQIKQDMQQLSEIFQKIDKSCRIIGFVEQRNAINFLNVKKFIGTEVGPVRLMFPDRWPGPFVRDNFSVFGDPYLVVRTKDGYFITPPDSYVKQHEPVKIQTTGIEGPMTQTIIPEEEY